MTDKINIV